MSFGEAAVRPDIAGRVFADRQVGRHHFALFRGSLDGLSLATLGERYLETGPEIRAAKATLEWVRQALIAAAGRHPSRTGVSGASFARLLRTPLPAASSAERAALAEIPSLEDFAAEVDPSGFYSEAELIEAFQERFGAGPSAAALKKAEQNDRLRRKLRQAIDVLENWLATTPKPGDPLAIWLDPGVVARLAAVGMETLEQLVAVINTRGNLWYRRIPQFGAIRARRVTRWLQMNQVLTLNRRALTPYRLIEKSLPAQRVATFALVPLEHLRLPVDLDGSMGTNRGHECQLAARNDLAALDAWLQLKGDNPNTRRAYASQAERYLLWLTLEKGRALSSATPEDCHEYTVFLDALARPGTAWPWNRVRAEWIGDKTKRWSQDWKPFTGDLSASSRRLAVTILKGLFAWLTGVGYLRRNPWAPVKTPRGSGRRIKVDHALNERQWAAVLAELEESRHPQAEEGRADERYCRLRFLLWLGYSGGLRQDEMIRLTAGNLRRTPEGDWELVFMGKGGKEREVPLARMVFAYLTDYLVSRGHGANPLVWDKALPLLTALSGELQFAQKTKDRPLAARTLLQILKRHFDAAAEKVEDLIDEDALRQASTHWLRHTAATNMIARGAQVAVVQEILGHADSATTALYTHADRKRKREAVELAVG
jgi:site-specific recombinase XerD